MRIELEVSDKNESTDSPYWLILDPIQMLRPEAVTVAGMITGPFFSRDAAEGHLKGRRYDFSKYAQVWCLSGWASYRYSEAFREAALKEARKLVEDGPHSGRG